MHRFDDAVRLRGDAATTEGDDVQAPGEIDEFCRAHHARLVGLLSLYCGDDGVAEELAQETLVRACTSWRKVREMDNAGAWLNRVGINLANSHFRRRAAERRATARLDPPAATTRDDDAAIALRDALAALPPRQRTALVLRFYADMSFAEIAHHMGATESTVKSLVRRGVGALRDRHGLVENEEVADVGEPA